MIAAWTSDTLPGVLSQVLENLRGSNLWGFSLCGPAKPLCASYSHETDARTTDAISNAGGPVAQGAAPGARAELASPAWLDQAGGGHGIDRAAIPAVHHRQESRPGRFV